MAAGSLRKKSKALSQTDPPPPD